MDYSKIDALVEEIEKALKNENDAYAKEIIDIIHAYKRSRNTNIDASVLTEFEKGLVYGDNFVVRRNLLTDANYSPYCGSHIPVVCSNPRTKFNGEQFVCPECGFKSEFPDDFIAYYKQKWGK